MFARMAFILNGMRFATLSRPCSPLCLSAQFPTAQIDKTSESSSTRLLLSADHVRVLLKGRHSLLVSILPSKGAHVRGHTMLIDLRLGIIWKRVGGGKYRMFACLADGNYYWELPLKLDIQFYASQMAF
jgi:hypothetical protein